MSLIQVSEGGLYASICDVRLIDPKEIRVYRLRKGMIMRLITVKAISRGERIRILMARDVDPTGDGLERQEASVNLIVIISGTVKRAIEAASVLVFRVARPCNVNAIRCAIYQVLNEFQEDLGVLRILMGAVAGGSVRIVG